MAGKKRAYGADAELLMAFETNYGDSPDGSGGGVYTKLKFKRFGISGSRDLEDDTLLGEGRDAQDPVYGAFDVSGSYEVPMDLRGSGFHLKGLFGVPATVDNGDGTYTHTFVSGGVLPSLTTQIGHTALATPKYMRCMGVKLGGYAFDMARTGAASATIDALAQGEEKLSATSDAAPNSYELRRFNRGSGAIKVEGVQLANVTGGSFSFSNNLEGVETIRDDGKIDGVDEAEAKATGSVSVRMGVDSTLSDAVASESPVSLQYGFKIPGTAYALTFELPRVFLPKPKEEISGPGGIEASYDWRAAKCPTAGHMLKVTLINDVASY
jgi:hypothetical protein